MCTQLFLKKIFLAVLYDNFRKEKRCSNIKIAYDWASRALEILFLLSSYYISTIKNHSLDAIVRHARLNYEWIKCAVDAHVSAKGTLSLTRPLLSTFVTNVCHRWNSSTYLINQWVRCVISVLGVNHEKRVKKGGEWKVCAGQQFHWNPESTSVLRFFFSAFRFFSPSTRISEALMFQGYLNFNSSDLKLEFWRARDYAITKSFQPFTWFTSLRR